MTNKNLSYILKCNSSCDGRAEFSASLHHTVFSVHDPSEIIMCWIDGQETFLIIINVEISCAA